MGLINASHSENQWAESLKNVFHIIWIMECTKQKFLNFFNANTKGILEEHICCHYEETLHKSHQPLK